MLCISGINLAFINYSIDFDGKLTIHLLTVSN
jgi:hypothetical protein